MKRSQLIYTGLLALVVLFTIGSAQGQTSMPQNNLVAIPPTPEASSLFKFTETPVGQFTGIPEINVPVYEIALRGMTLPISLNYHSGGYRVDEQSSDVGIGWALNAGGQISSSVFGTSDLEPNGYPNVGVSSVRSFPYNRPLDPQANFTGGSWVKNADYDTLMNITNFPYIDNSLPPHSSSGSPWDTKPDIFYYSMFGQSGKFFFTVDGQTHPMPFNKMKINFINGAAGFQIIDDKGNKYIFDVVEQMNTNTNATASDAAFQGGASQDINYSYYLSKVYTLQGDTVTLTYNTLTHYSYAGVPSYTRYRTAPNQSCAVEDISAQVSTLTDIYNGRQLSEITTNRGHKVHFTYQDCQRLDMPGRYALKQIDIYYNSQVKSFVLSQDYLNLSSYTCSTTADKESVKLKLKTVAITGSGNYSFDYNNEYDGYFPSRFNQATDHWGYYNGKGGSPFPADAAHGFTTGVDKTPDVNYCKMGVLNKIKYPTGGYTTYDYESNNYYSNESVTSTTGGFEAFYYDEDHPSETINFTIPATVDPSSIFIKYNCKNDVTSPRFNVTLNGPGASNMTFSGTSAATGNYITLAPGDYTLTKDQVGDYEDGYFQIFWTATTTAPPTNPNVNGGGLRIKTIKNFDNYGSLIPLHSRSFTYLQANSTNSSGQIYNPPSYYYLYAKNTYTISPDDASVLNTITCYYNTQTSVSNLPLSGAQFGNVVYNEVQEYELDNSGNNNGYTDNYYSFTPNWKPYTGYPFTPPTNYDWKNGNLLKSEIYKKTATGYFLQKRITNTYEDNYTPPSSTGTTANAGEDVDVYTVPVKPNETHAIGLNILVLRSEYLLHAPPLIQRNYAALFQVEAYNLVSAWQYLKSSYEEDFEPGINSPFTKNTVYSYNNPLHAQLTKTQQTNSDGKQNFSLTTYPQDYATGTTFMTDLTAANNIAAPVEKVEYEQLPDNSINILKGGITEYTTGGQGLLSNVYSLETTNPVALSSYKFSNATAGGLPNYASLQGYQKDSHYQLKASIPAYDANFNPTEVDVVNGIKTGYKWAGIDLKPVAVCKNAASNEFYYDGFEQSTLTGVQTTGGHTGHNCLYTTTYFQVNWTPPATSRTYVISYWYKTATGAWTYSGEQSYSGGTYIMNNGSYYDDIRIYPKDAQMTTYTYDAVIGMTSAMDAKGQTMYYEYDSLQRLVNIRDQNGNIVKHTDYHYQNQ